MGSLAGGGGGRRGNTCMGRWEATQGMGGLTTDMKEGEGWGSGGWKGGGVQDR